jgi:hypothetical protein
VKAVLAFVNGFLAAFGLDVALTVLDGVLKLAGAAPLGATRAFLAGLVFWCAPVLLLLALLSSRLPKRTLLPLALGTLWVNLGALPLGPALAGPLQLDVGLGLVQGLFALPALLWIRRRSGGTSWWLSERWLPAARPRRRWAVALAVLAVPLGLALLAAGCAVVVADRATGGFIGFGASGLTLDERHYRRDDSEVRLIGMSHVGRKGVYGALLAQADRTPTIVLEEGVTDEQGLLPREPHLEPLALELGLDLQPSAAEMTGAAADDGDEADDALQIEHADVDLGTFRPSTIEFLRLGLRLTADPADAEVRSELQGLVGGPDAREVYAGLIEDVIELRNRHLLERIDAALERAPRVIVPWGALHLAGIEAGLLARGFTLAASEPRSFLPYGALGRVLTRTAGP